MQMNVIAEQDGNRLSWQWTMYVSYPSENKSLVRIRQLLFSLTWQQRKQGYISYNSMPSIPGWFNATARYIESSTGVRAYHGLPGVYSRLLLYLRRSVTHWAIIEESAEPTNFIPGIVINTINSLISYDSSLIGYRPSHNDRCSIITINSVFLADCKLLIQCFWPTVN